MPQQAPAPHAAFEAQLRGIEQRLTNLEVWQRALLPDSGWLAVEFKNSWKNAGGENMTCAYRKQGNVVRLRGIIEAGANESSPFTLPEGFRPAATISPAAGTSALGRAARLVITSAGVVKVFYEVGIVGLDAITFTID